MIQVMRHRFNRRLDAIHNYIPDHFITLMIVGFAVITPVVAILYFAVGLPLFVGEMIFGFFVCVIGFLGIVGSGKRFKPDQAAVAERVWKRRKVRLRYRQMRKVPDSLIDALYNL